ncbi:MerR family transcriptional regulator [Shimazuella sp. AN120528]|uniref:MerR family transcriptional regulator n=1 Tax=Shimazuella soli TaxID=1892854 RepID=UPI001F10DCAA|nr:MerR family transcriptional regulator [Shimazuella soli]MCH5584763.1 MerR family transcriptional regulator [Shimazuella soli]
MYFTVKEMAEMSHITVKTLHHYHKIGLLLPAKITEAGYRLYSMTELERLQEILFYRELDFPLLEIKRLLNQESNRQKVLAEQKQLLQTRRNRLEQLLDTISKSIDFEKRGETMEKQDLFKGFRSEEEWREALKVQDQYLQDKYGYSLLDEQKEIQVDDLNQKAEESVRFTNKMIEALQKGTKFNDVQLLETIGEHVSYLKAQNLLSSDAQFVEQTKFFLEDDFHRTMLENQQTGLAYFLYVSAEAYVKEHKQA